VPARNIPSGSICLPDYFKNKCNEVSTKINKKRVSRRGRRGKKRKKEEIISLFPLFPPLGILCGLA